MRPSLLLLSIVVACAKAAPSAPAPAAAAPAHHDGEHAHDGAHDGATMHHRFDDAEKWASVFDDPERDLWQRPEALVAALAIQPGATVADVGAGTGYFNRYLAEAVGPEGHVLAIDVEPNLVAYMTERAQREGTPQVEARLGAFEDPHIQPAEADLVMLVDTYHHIDGRRAWFHALLGAMREGGRLVVIDFKPGELPVGPPPDHKLSAERVRAELTEAGWRHTDSLEILPFQYVEVFVPR